MRTFLFLATLLAGCNLAQEPIDERFEPSDALTLSAYNWSLWNHETVRSLQQAFDAYCRFTVTGDGRVATFDRAIDSETGAIRYHSRPSELDYVFELDDADRIATERRVRNGTDVLRRHVERDANGAMISLTTFNSFEQSERVRFRDGLITEYTDAVGRRWSYHYDAGVLYEVQYFDGGKLIQLDEYRYDDAGRLIAIDEARRTSRGGWTFGYTGDGRIIGEHLRTDGLFETVTLESDAAGRLLREQRTQHRHPDQATLLEWNFDAQGRITGSVVDGVLGRTTRQYAYVCE